jgi:arylsulfatase A-like enzyme
MNRFNTILAKVFCLLNFLFVFPFPGFPQTQRPNIIFILTDDQRWDALGFAGNTIIKTPEMDDLARSGTYFKNAFSTTPICAASRASILSGLYERTHGYTFQKLKLQQAYAEMIFPKILKDNGYHIGFFGKLGVIMDKPEQYFDQSDFYDRGAEPDRRGYFYKIIGKDTVHLTRYSGFQAQEFINNAPRNKPFCLSVFFSAPHAHDPAKDQFFWQEKSNRRYDNIVFPEPVLSDDKYFNQLPAEVKNGFNRTRWKWRFDTPDKYQKSIQGYYRMITEIDDEIGMLRKLLKERGLSENTIFIVMGDNGYFTGDRQLADKWLMYDASIRIPLIIYDPRINNPSSIDAMVLNIDVSKSILEFAGLQAPKNYQGISLNPFLLKGNKTPIVRKNILIEHLWKLPEIPSSEGIRTARWKYFRYRLIKAPEELYDLQNDPLETINLAGDARYSKQIKMLKKQLNVRSERYSSEKLVPEEAEITNMKF